MHIWTLTVIVALIVLCFALPANAASAEAFECKREDLTIRGTVFGKTEDPRPAVILSHHFTATKEAVYGYAQSLADAGYVTFAYDFCGGSAASKSDGATEDMSVETEVLDVLAVTAYVKSLPYVDAAHVTLLGCSQGGMVSALAAARHPGEYEKLILVYPALCIPDDARAGRMLGFSFDPQNLPDILCEQPIRLGRVYVDDVIGMDVYREIAPYQGPVLLLHGTKDAIVNIRYSEEASQVYKNCEYHKIEGANHGFFGKDDEEAIGYMKAFMAR